jgi:hypothetical protein
VRKIRSIGDSDCFCSALASLLECDRADIPNFYSPKCTGDDMHRRAQKWLEKTRGLTLVGVKVPPDMKMADVLLDHPRPVRFLAVVWAGDCWHAVVAGMYGTRIRMLHDPSDLGRIKLKTAANLYFVVPTHGRGKKKCRAQ